MPGFQYAREGGDGRPHRRDSLDAEEDTDQLKAALTAKTPRSRASVLQSAVLAVEPEYVTERLTLRDRDEVAIPPISGG